MFQRGPGEGYGAAKADALALDPSCYCVNGSKGVGQPFFAVHSKRLDGKRIGGGRIARHAWASALGYLEDEASRDRA